MLKKFLTTLEDRAFAPVDIASIVFFRIVFGLLMIWETWLYWSHDWIGLFWIRPKFLFKFYGFSWVHPWPGNALYVHWAMMGILALFITVGFWYRISTALFCFSLAYFFLLDEAQYLAHVYLICLFGFLLIFIPANRALSLDAWLTPKLRSETAPAWALWLLRIQIGVVYLFSGLGKLIPDWLHGELLRSRLATRTDFPVIGRFFREEWMVYAMSYGALLFDLLIVPLLLWRRTRLAAFCLAAVFNVMNAYLFNIYTFPWLAIAATALYFSPDWPRRILSVFQERPKALARGKEKVPPLATRRTVLTLIGIYVAIQIFVPLRHYFYRAGIEWTLAEHRFSWRMMLVSQTMRSYFYVTDPSSGRTYQVHPSTYLSPRQTDRMAWRPDMILQFAHYLAETMPRSGPAPLRVEARVFVSLNGRKPQMFVDPNVDLAAEPRTWGRPPWLLESHEPLPPPGERLRDGFAPRQP